MRLGADRRHHADGLCGGPGPGRARGLRHGRAGQALSGPHADQLRRCGGQGQDAGHVRLRAAWTRPPNMPPRTPTSPCACGSCSARLAAEGHADGLRDAGAAACPRCWAKWSLRASRSTATLLRGFPTTSRKASRRFEDEITRSSASPSISAPPSRSRDVLFGEIGLPGAQEDRHGQLEHRRQGAGGAGRERGANARSTAAAVEAAGMAPALQAEEHLHRRRCPSTSTRRPAAFTPLTRWPRPRPGGSRRTSRTCKTSRCAPRKAARSAPPSSPSPARC